MDTGLELAAGSKKSGSRWLAEPHELIELVELVEQHASMQAPVTTFRQRVVIEAEACSGYP